MEPEARRNQAVAPSFATSSSSQSLRMVRNGSQGRGNGHAQASADLRDTIDRAMHTGARLVENRVKLLALDARSRMQVVSRGGVAFAAAAFLAALGWLAIVATLVAALWDRLAPEAVFGLVAALHVILTIGLLLFGRNQLHALERERAHEEAERQRGAATGEVPGA